MAILSRTLVVLAVMGLVTPTAWGDVIPSRYAEDSKDRAKVESKLAKLGLPTAEAANRASLLTDDEAAYFARNTDRVRMVGQEMWGGQTTNLWWEFLIGITALVGTGVTIHILADNND